MMSTEQYRDQIEKQLREFGLDSRQIEQVLDTVRGLGDARYNDGFDDGKVAFRRSVR